MTYTVCYDLCAGYTKVKAGLAKSRMMYTRMSLVQKRIFERMMPAEDLFIFVILFLALKPLTAIIMCGFYLN